MVKDIHHIKEYMYADWTFVQTHRISIPRSIHNVDCELWAMIDKCRLIIFNMFCGGICTHVGVWGIWEESMFLFILLWDCLNLFSNWWDKILWQKWLYGERIYFGLHFQRDTFPQAREGKAVCTLARTNCSLLTLYPHSGWRVGWALLFRSLSPVTQPKVRARE